MITRDAKYMQGIPSEALLQGVLTEFDGDAARRDRLGNYYDGKHAILERSKTPGTSNNKLVVNHARYIADMAAAYLIGSPAAYTSAEESEGGTEGETPKAKPGKDALEALQEAYRRCDIDSIDAEIAKGASIYGRGVELLYMDTEARPRSAAMDPKAAFVVYDDTVSHAPLFGVRRVVSVDEGGKATGSVVYVDTPTHTLRYRQSATGGALAQDGAPEEHYFGGVPLIEYWNNEDERGDFEPVLTLIDAYNLLMSDRVNGEEQLVDAILMISGAALGDTDPEVNAAIQRLRDQRILEMPAVGATAAYLTKQSGGSEAQVLADAIERALHKIAMVPALTDEDFAGQASGVAMKFKLLGLEQMTKTKERWFREGLRMRLRLFANVLEKLAMPQLDPEAVQITFTRGLPVNELEQAQIARTLQGMVPEEILLRILPFVDDPEKCKQMLDEEREEAAQRQMAMRTDMLGKWDAGEGKPKPRPGEEGKGKAPGRRREE